MTAWWGSLILGASAVAAKLTTIPIEEGMLSGPTDLEFNPLTGQLWITNQLTDDFTIVHDAGTPQQAVRKLADRGKYHYMPNVSGIAFTAEGNVATSQEAINEYLHPDDRQPLMEANYFMGPTLFNSSDAELITNDGEKCVLGSERTCYLIHTDMLHEAPLAMGLVANKGYQKDPHEEFKAGPNSFWLIDGMCGTLIMYDFDTPHGPFSMDHDTARVHRYANIAVTRVPRVPMGLDMDEPTRTLYVADTGGKRVLKVYVDTSVRSYDAREKYTIYSSANAEKFDYWVYLGTKHEVFASVDMPSGVVCDGSYVYVVDYESGAILVFDKAGNRVNSYETNTKGWSGMTLHNNELWLVNTLTNSLAHIDIGELRGTSQCNGACGSANCARCDLEAACSADSECKSGLCGTGGKCEENPEIEIDSGCVKRGEMTPVIKPEPEPGDEDYEEPEAGYADPDAAIAAKDDYATMDKSACSSTNPNRDALLLSSYLCHPCLPNPCDNGGACTNLPKGYSCDCSRIDFIGDQCQTPRRTELPTSAPVEPTSVPTSAPATVDVRTTEAPAALRQDPVVSSATWFRFSFGLLGGMLVVLLLV